MARKYKIVKAKTGRELVAEVKRGGEPAVAAVHRFKNRNSPDEIFRKFGAVFSNPGVLEQIYGPPFPKSPEDLFSDHFLPHPANALQELTWALCRCAVYGSKLRAFVKIKQELETALVRSDPEVGVASLLEIEKEYGFSFWLAQNRLLVEQMAPEPDAARRYMAPILEKVRLGSLSRFVLNGFLKRTEAHGQLSNLREEIASAFAENEGSPFHTYALAKLVSLRAGDQVSIAPALYVESHSSIIDLYELSLNHVLRICALSSVPPNVRSDLAKPVSLLFQRTEDPRWNSALLSLGVVPSTFTPDASKAGYLEPYVSGDLKLALTQAIRAVEANPLDVLALCVVVKAQVSLNVDSDQYPTTYGGEIFRSLVEPLRQIFSLDSSAYAAANKILLTCTLHYTQEWASILRLIAMDALAEEGFEFLTYSLHRALLLITAVTPLSILVARGSARKALLANESIRQTFPMGFEAANILIFGAKDAAVATSSKLLIMCHARHLLAKLEASRALAALSDLRPESRAELLRHHSRMALASLLNNSYAESIRSCVDAFLCHPEVPSVLPLTPIVDELDDSSRWPETIDLPLIFAIFNLFEGREKISHLRYSFERFQRLHGIKEAKEFGPLVESLGIDRVIAYLNHVWTPEAMRQTRLYRGSAEIEDARVDVCRMLVTLDPESASEYTSEIKERVKHREIAKGVTLVDQSKVYVDVAAIKRTLKNTLGGSFSSYRALSQVETENDRLVEDLGDLFGGISASTKQPLLELVSDLHLLQRDPSTAAQTQFDSFLTEIMNEFLRGAHGLNAYLSTRVRHGRLSNELRKAVADDKLVTNTQRSGDAYEVNSYWLEQMEALSSSERERVSMALNTFTKSFDQTIAIIRDNLIQIHVTRGLAGRDDPKRSVALLRYGTTNLERRVMQYETKSVTDLDDFVDKCVDVLWAKTDQNLLVLRNALESNVARVFQGLFDDLLRTLETLPDIPAVGDLRNSIHRARVATQHKVGEIASWFKRSAVYDREDYGLSYPVEIASTIIQKTLPDDRGFPSIDLKINGSDRQMPGRSLDLLVDSFYGLISNAIAHSNVSCDDLKIEIELSLSDGTFSARFSNNLGPNMPSQEQRERIARIRGSLDQPDAWSRAQVEGESGTYKLWRSINSPLYRDPELDFRFTDDNKFSLDLKFTLEDPVDESSAG